MAINGKLYLPTIRTYLFLIHAHRNELMFIKCPLQEHTESITVKRRQQDGNKTKTRRKRYEGSSTLHRDTPQPPLEPYKERKCCPGTQASRLRANSHKLLSYAKLPGYAGVPACPKNNVSKIIYSLYTILPPLKNMFYNTKYNF